jgi:hypothetical protein
MPPIFEAYAITFGWAIVGSVGMGTGIVIAAPVAPVTCIRVGLILALAAPVHPRLRRTKCCLDVHESFQNAGDKICR